MCLALRACVSRLIQLGSTGATLAPHIGGMPTLHTPHLLLQRRALLQRLAALGAVPLAACGGGGSSGTDTTTGPVASSSTTATGTSTASTSTTGTTSTTSSGAVWPWVGTSTVAIEPTLADFASVATSPLSYRFHTSVVSSTTDPISGLTSDTSTVAQLAPFLMSRTLVTNANWRAFCNAAGSAYYPSTARTAGRYWSDGAYPNGKAQHPVFFVSYTNALAYCTWLETRIPTHRFYVPTEGEWEYAALGDHTGYDYPWGSDTGITWDAASGTLTTSFNANPVCTRFVLLQSGITTLTYYADTTVTTLADGSTPLSADSAPLASVLSLSARGSVSGWQYDSSSNRTWADFANSDQFRELVDVYGGYSTPVGTYPSGASWCGCLDMAGNAYEWTSTRNVASNGAESGSVVHCVKGGSWYSNSTSGRSSGRGEGRAPEGAYHSVGFRVAARPR